MSLHGVELHLDSPFQRRQVEADISSSFLTYEGITDSVLIIDLIDERFDLAETGASILTLSRELENSGFLRENNFKTIQAQSEKRKELWRAGLKNFAAAIKIANPTQILIHKAYWCASFRNPEGELETFKEGTLNLARRHNAQLSWQYEEMSQVFP